MNRLRTFAFVAALLMSSAAVAADGGKGYEAYKLMRTRHIFDPNRKAVREAPPRSNTPPRPRTSTFTLTGTMVREGRSLAFFSGSRPEFSKVISVGDSVANYKITGIETGEVALEHEGKKLKLEIGKPFQIETAPGAPGEPEPAEDQPPPDGTNPPEAASPPAPSATPAAPAGSDAKSEILRRMMERRAKEMNK